MKIVKSKKALSPVVASIILIAVTVAVSIAVAAWMGALSMGFMGTEEIRVTKITWIWGNNKQFVIAVNNTGTKDVTITQVLVNYGTSGVTASGLPLPLKAGASTTITVGYAYTNGTKYDITVVTQSGNRFTNQFIGGQDVK
ncbi:MAG: archaellin/type IV pilin N-terminal domain-containing protein [Candidatus Bathyarchaeia archaeon]